MTRKRVILMMGALAVAQTASGAVYMTFADPSNGREVIYTAPGPGDTTGHIAVTADVSLQFDLTPIGLGVITMNNVHYTKVGNVGAVTVDPIGDFEAEVYDGHFEYRDAGNNLILSGDYGLTGGANGGNMIVSGPSGSIITNSTPLAGSLTYTFGSAIAPGTGGLSLPDFLAANGYSFGAAVDGNWTMTAIAPLPQLLEGGFLASFDANAAFTGTVEVVPTPGFTALAGISAGMVMLRRRRA